MLKENYKDDIFPGNRLYHMIKNDDGTYSFVDATNYTQVGDLFGSIDINATNAEINKIGEPTFEDYETGTALPDLNTAIGQIKKNTPINTLWQYIKASVKGLKILADAKTDSSLILDTMEQIMANTVPNRMAGALALKQLK